MDGDFSLTIGWVSDQSSEYEIPLLFGQRRLSFYQDPPIPHMKENEKLLKFV